MIFARPFDLDIVVVVRVVVVVVLEVVQPPSTRRMGARVAVLFSMVGSTKQAIISYV